MMKNNNREQREPSSSLRNVDEEEMRHPSPSFSKSNNDEIVLTPKRQLWRRLFRVSPTPSATSSSSPSSSSSSSSSSPARCVNKGKSRNHHLRHGGDDDNKSHSSSGSSSQSGSDDSDRRNKPREQRVAKYLSIDTITTRPISLIANEGDLTFHKTSSDTRDDNDDEDDYYYNDEWNTEEACRDDVRLLHASSVVFQSHLLHTPKALREPSEDEDRVALLSEHDDLLENRRGSYNVDSVDPLALSGPAALQRLSLLSLKQELVVQEEKFNFEINYVLPQQQHGLEIVVYDSQPRGSSNSGDSDNAFVPLQIDFPSGETKEGVGASSLSQSSSKKFCTQSKKAKPTFGGKKIPFLPKQVSEPSESPTSTLNPLGEETPAYSEIIQDRTRRHKAFYLLRLRNSQKKNHATTPRPSVHGDLFTLNEMPSEDESSSRFSQLSESLASRMRVSRSNSGDRSGAWSANPKTKHVILEDQVALISAI